MFQLIVEGEGDCKGGGRKRSNCCMKSDVPAVDGNPPEENGHNDESSAFTDWPYIDFSEPKDIFSPVLLFDFHSNLAFRIT